MSKKDLEIVCPCCESRLLIDVLTEKVLRTRRPEEIDEAGRPKVGENDWDSAFDRARDRSHPDPGRLDDALDRERARGESLEDRFEEARRRAEQKDDETN